MNYCLRRSLVAALLAVAVIMPAASAGTPLSSFTVTGAGYSNVVTVSGNGGQSSIEGYAGRYDGQLDGQDINVFCVDLNHDINFGQGYQADVSHGITDSSGTLQDGYYNGGLSSALDSGYYQPSTGTGLSNQARADEVGFLIHNYDYATDATFNNGYDLTTNMTAVSLAIWNIESNGGGGLTNSGAMQTDPGTTANYGSLVNQYEQEASTHDNSQYLDVRWIQAPVSNGSSLQSFAYVAPFSNVKPVPEVKSGVLFAVVLTGGFMLIMLKRRKTAVKSAE